MSLIEIAKSRDVVVLSKGDCITVELAPSFTSWTGGTGASWSSGGSKDTFEVERSDGLFGGFALWGSDETGDQFVSLTGSQPTYGYIVLGTGNWVCWFKNYEVYTYATRNTPFPVPIVYSPQQPLYFSLRGYFTNEDEWTLSGDPRAPNPLSVGYVVCPPENVGDPIMVETTI